MSERYTAVIPAYNAAATIAVAVRSVLAQSVPPATVIIVDDGSTDETGAIAARLDGPVRVIRQDNAGPGSATTTGFAQVDTPLVATLDADDLWLPEKLAAQLAALGADSGLAAVFGRIATFREDPALAEFGAAYDGWSRTTMLARVDAVQQTGPMCDPPGKVGEMIDWLARMRETGWRLAMLPQVVALRRIHPGSLTYGRVSRLAPSYLQVVRAAMERRRSRPGGE
ncbi:glycosyltransferase family 2 protein [Devosia sp.]|uniref:glycosyltransferase family 2 protein n=1 Tax=Devosia sp. TaxID=1871048 RepID=UPI002EEB0773